MSDWDSALYLKYKTERTQPSYDLAARLPRNGINRILDLGCGPGNSTAVLAEVYPRADILGVDGSENMIDCARSEYPQLNWQVCLAPDGLDALPHNFDLVFSNAVSSGFQTTLLSSPRCSSFSCRAGRWPCRCL